MMPMQTPLLSHSPKSTSTFFIPAPYRSTFTGMFCQPATFCMWTRLQLSKSTSYRGMKSSSFSSAVAVDVELVGIGPRLTVPVRRTIDQEHRVPLWDRCSVQVNVSHGPAYLILRRSLKPEQFLHGGRDLAAV